LGQVFKIALAVETELLHTSRALIISVDVWKKLQPILGNL
jgi:hypothetical protein